MPSKYQSLSVLGDYHFIMTLTHTLIKEHGYLHIYHSSIHLSTKKYFSSRKKLVEFTKEYLKQNKNLPYNISEVIADQVGTWEISLNKCINDEDFLDWFLCECSSTPLEII